MPSIDENYAGYVLVAACTDDIDADTDSGHTAHAELLHLSRWGDMEYARRAYVPEALRPDEPIWPLAGPRLAKKGFFLRAETAFSMTESLGGVPGYWAENTAALSHGEGFVAILRSMFTGPGFYVLDEPESALSFTTSLYLVALLHELSSTGAQIVCATHSPILASTPGADIVEVGPHGLRRVKWADLELVDHWRRYLDNPHNYLRHLLDQ